MEIQRLEVSELAQLLHVRDGYISSFEFQQSSRTKFPENSVEVDYGYAYRVSENGLGHWKPKRVVCSSPNRRQPGVNLDKKMCQPALRIALSEVAHPFPENSSICQGIPPERLSNQEIAPDQSAQWIVRNESKDTIA
jgi:hypothetical protein